MSSERGFMDLNEYYFSNGDFIQVTCYKYKNKYISDYTNHGRLGIIRKELDELKIISPSFSLYLISEYI